MGQPDWHRPPVRPAAQTVYGFGAYDLSSSLSGVFKALSGVATLAGLAAAAWLVWRRARASGGLGPADWAGAFTLGTFAFVLPTRVLSPQYLVWLCAPMVGLAAGLAGRRALWTLVAAALVSQVIFPFRYTQLRRLYPFDISLLTLRNLLLVLACALAVQAFNRRPPGVRGLWKPAGDCRGGMADSPHGWDHRDTPPEPALATRPSRLLPSAGFTLLLPDRGPHSPEEVTCVTTKSC